MIEDEFQPNTEPSGSLDPPSRKPPTAVGTAGSDSNPDDRRYSVVTVVAKPNALGRFLSRAFDMIDEAADKVATVLHIGPPRTGT
jgi:hypothetical protein